MGSWVNEIVIDASPSVVFGYIADLSRHPEWAQQPLRIRQTSTGPVVVGSTFESMGKAMGERRDAVTITELVPGERITCESDGWAGAFRNRFEVTARDEGSRASGRVSSRSDSAVLAERYGHSSR